MAKIKCLACGKRYDYYEHGCCPECGAYNRPPQRNRVDADGTVHHLNDSEFFDDSAARRRQSGKVCFEREECHEDQVHRSASPFDSVPSQKKKKDSSPAGGVKKLVKTVAIVVVLVNLLPLLLTMCSISDVMDRVEDLFTNVDVEPVRPEPLPDGETAYTTDIGNTFIWWDHDAAVVDVTMDQQVGTTFLDLTMWRVEAYDEPVVFYDTVDGWQEKSGCDDVTVVDEETFVYHYTLDGYQPGGECYAFFDGYNGNVYCEVKVPLAETPLDDDSMVQAAYAAELGETFLWWNEETSVDGVEIVEDGSDTEVHLTVWGNCDFDMPYFAYRDENGEEQLAWCEEIWHLAENEESYLFRVSDRMPGTECWALFADDAGEVRVLLN